MQRLIFDKPENGVRKIVLSTNIAETGIPTDDVVFVIDCGKAKEISYDALNNTPCLLPSWISKASAGQATLHLFWSMWREEGGQAAFSQASVSVSILNVRMESLRRIELPEIFRTPLQSICLQIKSLQLGSISDYLSRALQSPERLSVQNAIEYLKIIGALDEDEQLTVLGRHLSMLPVEPKLGKTLVMGALFNCLHLVLTVVAGLSMSDQFLMPIDKKDLAEQAKSQFAGRDYSDHFALMRFFQVMKVS